MAADPLLYSFDWDNNGSYEVVDQTLTSASTSFGATGSYVVGVRVRDGDGGVATGTTTVVVQPQTLTATAISNSGPVRRAQPVTVIVTGTQAVSYTHLDVYKRQGHGRSATSPAVACPCAL